MSRQLNFYDEGVILVGAEQATAGRILHRDFFATYGPGQFYILALLFKILSPSVMVERIWDISARASICILLFLISAKRVSRTAQWAVFSASVIWLAYLRQYGYPTFPAFAATLVSLIYLLPYMENDPPRARLFLAGFFAGLSFLFRYDLGLTTLAVDGILLCLYGFVKKRFSFMVVAKETFPLVSGFAVIFLPLLAAYVLYGVFDDFIFDVFFYAMHIYPKMRSLPFPALYSLVIFPVKIFIFFGPLACVSAIIACACRSSSGGENNKNRWLILALSAAVFFLFLKCMVRISEIYLFMASLLSLPLLAIVENQSQALPRYLRESTSCICGLIACSTLYALYLDFGMARENMHWLADGGWQASQNSLQRLSPFEFDDGRKEAVDYILRHTKASDFLFVGCERHDQIFANDVSFYFLANRKPATKWFVMEPGIETTDKIQREVISDLDATRPPYIVLETLVNYEVHNGSAMSSGIHLLDDYIGHHFKKTAQFGKVTVLRNLNCLPCGAAHVP